MGETVNEKAGGITIPFGAGTLRINPPEPKKEGVIYGGAWLKVEADDEGDRLMVRLFAEATYTDAFDRERKVVDTVDIEDEGLAELRTVIQAVIAGYAPVLKERLLAQAYRVREHSLIARCGFCDHKPEHPAGECRTDGCKCENSAKEVK